MAFQSLLRILSQSFPEAMTCPCSWRPFKGSIGGLTAPVWPIKEGSLLPFVTVKNCSQGKIQRFERHSTVKGNQMALHQTPPPDSGTIIDLEATYHEWQLLRKHWKKTNLITLIKEEFHSLPRNYQPPVLKRPGAVYIISLEERVETIFICKQRCQLETATSRSTVRASSSFWTHSQNAEYIGEPIINIPGIESHRGQSSDTTLREKLLCGAFSSQTLLVNQECPLKSGGIFDTKDPELSQDTRMCLHRARFQSAMELINTIVLSELHGGETALPAADTENEVTFVMVS
ncbi:hypothetical protein AAY473_011304 [Plecturocebus cupreus]